MSEFKEPMTGSYKAVFIFSLIMTFFVFIMGVGGGSKGHIGTLIWGYTAWLMYKRNNAQLVGVYKGLLWLTGGAAILMAFVFLAYDADKLGYSSVGVFLLLGLVFAVDFSLLKFFEGQVSASAKRDKNIITSVKGRSNHSSVNQMREFTSIQKSNIKLFDSEELSDSEEWSLAIKYDENLKQDYSNLLSLDAEVAKAFKEKVVTQKLVASYKEIYSEYEKKALGVNDDVIQYSKNKLINQIIKLVIKDSPVVGKEIIQLIKLYKLEDIDDYELLVSKLMPLLEKVEEVNGVSITKKINVDMSNDALIKYGMYSRREILGVDCLFLPNQNCVVVRSAEYRIYDSQKSATDAIKKYNDMGSWVLKGLVDKLPVGFEEYGAKCPSCDAPIQINADVCYRCNSVFDEASEWKPIAQ